MKKVIVTCIILFNYCLSSAQQIDFSDINFKNALLDLSVDLNNDFEVSQFEAQQVIKLDLSNYEIFSLDGIEFFSNLQSLDCSNNSLDTLNIDQNIKLQFLNADNNFLENLDLSNNQALQEVTLSSNNFESIDFTTNSELSFIDVSFNLLETIDISTCSELTFFDCSQNRITDLDLNQNNLIISLFCNNNNLVHLDLLGNPDLEELDCSNNSIAEICVDDPENFNENVFVVKDEFTTINNCTITSISNFDADNGSVKVLSNPVTEQQAQFIITSSYKGNILAKLYDSQGGELYSVLSTKASEEYFFEIPVSNIASGMYSLVIHCDDKVLSKKIIVYK